MDSRLSGAERTSEAISSAALFLLVAFVLLAPLTNNDVDVSVSQNLTGEGNLLRQVAYLLIFGLALLGARIHQFPQRLLAFPVGITLVLAWCWMSVLWATNHGVSIRRLTLTTLIVWSAFLIVQRTGYERTVAAIRIVLPLIVVASYVAVFAMPQLGIHQDGIDGDENIGGAWRGIVMHKNNAGPLCAFAVIFYSLDSKRIHLALRAAVIIGAAYFLYRTGSKTSMSLLLASLLIAAAFTKYNPYYRVVVALCLGVTAALAGILTIANWDRLMAAFSEEGTLTGRVQIWPALFQYWQDHWLLGSGFGSFWNVGEPKPIAPYVDVYHEWIAQISSGHNGYLDFMVQTGLPGLLLAVAAVAIAPLYKFITSSTLDRSRGALLLACIFFALCHNFTETSLFERDATVHVFLMMAIALLWLETRKRRPEAATPSARIGAMPLRSDYDAPHALADRDG